MFVAPASRNSLAGDVVCEQELVQFALADRPAEDRLLALMETFGQLLLEQPTFADIYGFI